VRVALAALLVALAVAVPSATAHRADTPGVTDTTIKIGGTVPLSGPAAAFGVTGPGAAAYFAYVNDRGGVNGRKIQYEYLDDGYNPTQTVQLTRQLVQQDDVLAIFNTIGTDNALAVRPFLNQLNVPMLFAGTGASAFGDPRGYPWSMPYLPNNVGEGALYGNYIVAHLPKAKVGVLQEADAYGKDLTVGLRKALGRKVKIVDVEGYALTDTSVSSQIAKLKAKGANTLVTFATPQFAIQALLAANKLGWRPRIFISSVSIEPTVMSIISASTSPKFVEGILSMAFVKDPTSPTWAKDPAVKLYRQIMARYDPQGRPTDVYNFYGMAVAYSMVDVLRKAGRNLTRDSLLKAATHLTEKNNPFLLPGIVLHTSPTDYFPMDQASLARFHNGRWVFFGPLVAASAER
jgi:ABC-type branched-subunit amino acid transport system substrate-binding protein